MVIKEKVNVNCIYVLWVNADIVVSFLNGHFLLVYLGVLSFPFFLLLFMSLDYK